MQGASKNSGANIIQYGPTTGAENELFKFEPLECGFYRIGVKVSGKVLEVKADGDNFKDGKEVIQNDWQNTDNQKFRIEPLGDGYYRIISKHTYKVLTVRGATGTDSTLIEQWHWVNQDNQKWKIEGANPNAVVGPLKADTCRDSSIPTDFTKVIAKHSGKALNLKGGGKDNGADFIQYGPTTGAENELFKFEYVGCGFYKIIAKHSGKALDITAGGDTFKNGTQARQWDFVNADNQLFRVESLGGGSFRILSKHSGKALTVRSVAKDDGAIVEQWEWVDADNQKWKLG